MNTQPINTPDRARGDEPAELDPAMVEAAAREWHENDPTEPRAWDALADDERGWYVETTRKSLSAAGVPRLVAEVERLRVELEAARGRVEASDEGFAAVQTLWHAALARATSAEQERDRLRAGIEALAARFDRIDPQWWVARETNALLAGSGEQPGEEREFCKSQKPPHYPHRPASVVPDSRGLRERVRGVLTDAARRESFSGTDIDALTDAVLAVVGQGVTAEVEDEECAPDCDERAACDKTGLGHSMCGRCEHGEPRHHGGHFHCAAVRPTGQEQADG